MGGTFLCSPASFEDVFIVLFKQMAEQLDDIKYYNPSKAFVLMSAMLKGPNLDDAYLKRLALKSVDCEVSFMIVLILV